MLARFKTAYIPKPGGDKIGRRRLDTHIIGFKKLGAEFDYFTDESFFHLHTSKLKGPIFYWKNQALQEPQI